MSNVPCPWDDRVLCGCAVPSTHIAPSGRLIGAPSMFAASKESGRADTTCSIICRAARQSRVALQERCARV